MPPTGHKIPPPPTVTSSYRPGQKIFEEGEASKSLYLIRKGTVSIQKRKGADYVELGRAFANEVLGELSFFDRQPRSAAAVALTETEVIEIPFDSMERIYSSVPDYVKTMVASMAERLRKANEQIKKHQREVIKSTEHDVDTGDTGPSASEALAQLEESESKQKKS